MAIVGNSYMRCIYKLSAGFTNLSGHFSGIDNDDLFMKIFTLKFLRYPAFPCTNVAFVHWIIRNGLRWFFLSNMMTSSNGNIFRVTGFLCGEFTGPGEYSTKRPVTRSFDVFFDMRLDKRLSKQSWGWWFETQSCPLWRQCNGTLVLSHVILSPNAS